STLRSVKREMDIEQASHLSIEIDLASLDARAEQRALTNFENFSCQSQTIGVDEPSDTDTVADFHLSHDSLSRTRSGRHRKLCDEGTRRATIFPEGLSLKAGGTVFTSF